MKKILSYIIMGILGVTAFTACSDDESYPTPTALDASTLSYEAKAGAVKLKWKIPENANYKYIKVTYTLPESGKECLRLASVYSDTILVDNLLKRYGDIVFTLQPCSADGNGGEICSITAQAAAANKQTVTISKDFKITGEGDAWNDAQETSEGPLKNLFDGSTASDNYFHMSWSASTPFPHYIVVDLKEETNFFSFTYTARDNANCDNPKEMDILVSKELVGSKPDYVNETGTTKLASLSELPGTRKASYMSDRISSDETFRYVWFKVLSATSGSDWIALSELALKQVTTTIYDPETGETVVVED